MPTARLGPELFAFLRALARNNDRAWFAAQKPRYERDVRDPLLGLITELQEPLARVSRQVVVDPRPVGGSLFRIHRDTRFSKDKSPYRAHAAAHFRHRAAKDVHSPGFYLHLEPGRHLRGGRHLRASGPARARRHSQRDRGRGRRPGRRPSPGPPSAGSCTLEGESVTRVPRGFDPAHPLIEHLKRKDVIAVTRWKEAEATSATFARKFLDFCRAGPRP